MNPADLAINDTSYRWTARMLRLLQSVLKVNIKVHPDTRALTGGEILVFNHFARFETFIPQYLLFEATGDYCRAIADREFFDTDNAFASYLKSVGAVPNNLPELMIFLVMEVLRGRRLVVFPEGGMVKDRRVMDAHGEFRIYSRTTSQWRKLHAGAAVIALAVAACRRAIRQQAALHDTAALEHWASLLDMEVEALLASAGRRTCILPANITFYPIRVQGNVLARGVALFHRGLSRRLREELIIESNILLRDTDMDIRVGQPLAAEAVFGWWEELLLRRLCGGLHEPLAALPRRTGQRHPWRHELYRWLIQRAAPRLRDHYMSAMYREITVNLCHLAAVAIRGLRAGGIRQLALADFQRLLYLMVKSVQGSSLYLHRGLRDPAGYQGLLEGRCDGLQQFLDSLHGLGLVALEGTRLRLLPGLDTEPPLDTIRLENPLAVYANEVAPLTEVSGTLTAALADDRDSAPAVLVGHLLDDDRRALVWLRREFHRPRYRALPANPERIADPTPFLLRPEQPLPLGVLLVHGFLASPAELRDFGRELRSRGFTVYGVRLAGHGTSPWDLQGRHWGEWLASVRRGYRLLTLLADRVALVGSASGGLLSLLLAAEQPVELAGVATVNTPLGYRAAEFRHLPLVGSAQRLIRPWGRDSMPFLPYAPAHPALSYRHIPLQGLQELRRLNSALKGRLADVQCPVLLVQGDQDPVVEPDSARQLLAGLGSTRKRLVSIPTHRHSIIHEGVGETRAALRRFLAELAGLAPPGLSGRATGR